MKILYMTIAFDLNGSGLYNNLVDELIEQGHEITIVKSNSSNSKTKLMSITDNLSCLDVKTGSPFEHNKFKKGINLLLLNTSFKRAIKKHLRNEEYDLILYATPPITLCGAVKYCKKKYSAKTLLMLKDIFPQNAVDLGMMKKQGIIFKYFRRKEKKYYKYSDYIGCMSQGNIDYIKKHNPEVDSKKLFIFPNSIKVEKNIETTFNNDKTVFMFGGNLGKPQNITLLLNIIKNMENYNKAKFVIIGNGTEDHLIKEFLDNNELNNFNYSEKLPQSEYEKVLKKIDVGLISLDPRFTIPNIPSRFQAYMKLKKPVLAITDTNTDLKEMIRNNECGWWCDATKETEVIETIKHICENKKQQIEYGENGFDYLCEKFDVKINVNEINELMKREGC